VKVWRPQRRIIGKRSSTALANPRASMKHTKKFIEVKVWRPQRRIIGRTSSTAAVNPEPPMKNAEKVH
jgi:hypothetical protein